MKRSRRAPNPCCKWIRPAYVIAERVPGRFRCGRDGRENGRWRPASLPRAATTESIAQSAARMAIAVAASIPGDKARDRCDIIGVVPSATGLRLSSRQTGGKT